MSTRSKQPVHHDNDSEAFRWIVKIARLIFISIILWASIQAFKILGKIEAAQQTITTAK